MSTSTAPAGRAQQAAGRGAGRDPGRRASRDTGRDAGPSPARHGRRAAPTRTSTLQGTGTLLRFALRRDRVRLPVWVAAAGTLVAVQSTQSQDLYSAPGALQTYAASMASNPAVVAMTGPPVGLDTIGGAVVFEIGTTVAVVVALMSLFTVVRHSRGDEEAGRTELLRAARLGRHAVVAAAMGTVAVAAAGVVLAVTAAGIGTGLPAGGSVLFGLSLGVLALVFGAVAAVAAQLAEHSRAALGLAGVVLGAAVTLRAAGDVGDGRLSWASPVGWTQAVHAYSGNRWWPLLPGLALTGLLLAGALRLLDRRDLGAGLVPPRRGPAGAGRSLAGPLGLAWRLHRAALAGWAAGVAVTGLLFGALVDATLQLAETNPDVVELLPGGAQGLADAFLAVLVALCALLAAGAGISAALRPLAEESSGRAELVLGGAVGRGRWLAGHLAVALAGSGVLLLVGAAGVGAGYALDTGRAARLPEALGAGLALLPAVALLVAVTAALVGLLPRAAAAASWALLGYAAVVAMLADSLDWPDPVRALSPLHWAPAVPAEPLHAAPLVVLSALAAVVVGAALLGFRRRDVG